MKRILTITAFVAFFVTSNLFAQDVLVVEPGIGTLNAAIEANKGDKIYQLQAGQWYQLNASIENVDYHLQIIGEEPADGGIPATLQTNSNAEGAVFDKMFNAFGDITIKSVYIMNIDLLGSKATWFLVQNDPAGRTVIDNCILDPVANTNPIVMSGGSSTFFTNNQVFNHGNELGPNDGHFFVTDNNLGIGIDTLYVENNTFVCMGTNMFEGGFTAVTHNYVKFNHNTFVMQKSQLDWSLFEETYIFTNNLMFDFQTQPWAYTWQPMPGGDLAAPMPALIYADTIADEVLPSTRQQFIQYNMLYRNPGFYTQLVELNELADQHEKANLYYMPLIWPVDSMDAQPSNLPRETFMFENDEAFPNWKFGNYLENIDPQFVDQEIYKHSDEFVKWTKPASIMHALGLPDTEYPPNAEWATYFWNPDGDHTINNTWPLFNGVYTNPELLTASIEVNVPLGDLNWFPEAKAAWEANKADIDAHIHAGNENQIDIGYVPTDLNAINSTTINTFSMYPNPAQNVLYFEVAANAKITVMAIDGRTIKSVEKVSTVDVSDLSSGVYLVKVELDTQVSTQILLIEK